MSTCSSRRASRIWLAPTVLAATIAAIGTSQAQVTSSSHCPQLNSCRIQGTLTPRVIIEASGASGKDGDSHWGRNGEWGTHGERGKHVVLDAHENTKLEGLGQFPDQLIGAAVLHISTSGGWGGNGGRSTTVADGIGGRGGDGGSVRGTLRGTYKNTSSYPFAHAVSLYSRGGEAGRGFDRGRPDQARAGQGGVIQIGTSNSSQLSITAHAQGASALFLDTQGGRGADGRKLAAGFRSRGGDGGKGGIIHLDLAGHIETEGGAGIGIEARSSGGDGGTAFGGTQYPDGAGGTGGQGGNVSGYFGLKTGRHTIKTQGAGLDLRAEGGDGGRIENSSALNAPDGGKGGKGGGISFELRNTDISTESSESPGVNAIASGGPGFWGGDSVLGKGGSAGAGGDGGQIKLTLSNSHITTHGPESHGAAAVADGGGGHTGGAGGAFSRAGDGSQGGRGGNVNLFSDSQITTHGSDAMGLYASSAGGNAGDGGRARSIVAVGGNGGRASGGGSVDLFTHGNITTHGDRSHAAFAQTIGGGGGVVVGDTDQHMAIGGTDTAYSPSASGGALYLANVGTATTRGDSAVGLLAQSVGGGGGAGGKAAGLISIGGHGQSGGNAGKVQIDQTGTVNTLGEESVAVLAQSVGGGGGFGGDVFSVGPIVSLGIGGRGGSGGSGGEVRIQHAGTTTTEGRAAQGILAQSIGGGGGHGGSVSGAGVVSAVTFTLGGSGGTGGSAGLVHLPETRGAISTRGDNSVAIQAQSIGGGGGNGGNSESTSIGMANIGIGGSGGTGGHGGKVEVVNAAELTTQGKDASALFAQSIGGGGGNGGSTAGSVISIPTPKAAASASVQVGGKGGGAGNASSVTILNAANISTQGSESRGIIAQSIGGGGGKGGSASADSLTIHTGLSFSASVALGGSGGEGGKGGLIDLTQQGDIHTVGSQAEGILAQSVGGGGGMGAAGSATTSASGSKSFSLAFALGGSGGKGGDGNTVKLKHSGSTLTQGDQSRGVIAQSIGGGGGYSAGAHGGADSDTFDSSIIVGGRGGGGGHGGTVSIDAAASSLIGTSGWEATGLLVQSIGGGGGVAGLTGTLKPDEDDKDDDKKDDPDNAQSLADDKDKDKDKDKDDDDDGISVKFEFALGGDGGTGGRGGQVTVNHAGQIMTAGKQANAIVAQSIGGGGGAAGAARNESDDGDIALTLAIGGKSGGGGSGGAVKVTQSGSIQTFEAQSHGILAQSVGGGGGLGSINTASSDADISLGGAFGRTGGGQGNGGAVTVDNSGLILTQRYDSYAILAQSIGGGGGVVSVDNDQPNNDTPPDDDKEPDDKDPQRSTLHLSIGGSNGPGGSGGNVTVNNLHTAQLHTLGAGAHALFAQSIGGGGGIGLKSDNTGQFSLSLGGKGTGGGSGGKVQVTNHGSISTQGWAAYGILAQSVGGGGGVSGSKDMHLVDSPTKLPSSSSGRDGKGGDIVVSNYGRIETLGENSAGILAQSIGGGGGIGNEGMGASGGNRRNSEGGNITVNIGGQVLTHGKGAPGIFAQSQGAGDTNGKIAVSIEKGGYVQTLGAQGTAINVHGGNQDNTIHILEGGTVASVQGNALFSGTDTRLAVSNQGHLAGSIDLSSHSSNTLTNQGRFDPGSNVKVGSSATLQNQGRLNPHGAGFFGTTHLHSALNQSKEGTLEADVDFLEQRSDTLTFSQNLTLAGEVHTLARNPLPDRTLTIVEGSGSQARLTLAPELTSRGSLLYDYPLHQPTEQSVAVSVEADFRANDSALSSDQRNLAGYLQEAWDTDSAESLHQAAVVFDQFVNIENVEQYRTALDTLASDAGQGPAAYIPLNNRSFFTRLMSCPSFYQHDASMREQDCIWGKFQGNHTRRDSTHETSGFTVESQVYQLGGQKEIAPGWFLGGSLAYEASRHRVSGLPVRTEGDGIQAGVVLKREMGPWLVAGSLTGGHSEYKTRRSITLTDTAFDAHSRWRTQYASAGLRASYVHAGQSWYVKPMLDFSLTYQRMPGYSEKGAGPLNLHLDKASQWSSMISPSLELGGRYDWRGNTLRPYVSAGISWLSDTGWNVKARLEGDPEQRQFELTTDLPRHFGEVKTGVVLTRKNGVELKAEYGVRFASNYLSQTGELRLAVPF